MNNLKPEHIEQIKKALRDRISILYRESYVEGNIEQAKLSEKALNLLGEKINWISDEEYYGR